MIDIEDVTKLGNRGIAIDKKIINGKEVAEVRRRIKQRLYRFMDVCPGMTADKDDIKQTVKNVLHYIDKVTKHVREHKLGLDVYRRDILPLIKELSYGFFGTNNTNIAHVSVPDIYRIFNAILSFKTYAETKPEYTQQFEKYLMNFNQSYEILYSSVIQCGLHYFVMLPSDELRSITLRKSLKISYENWKEPDDDVKDQIYNDPDLMFGLLRSTDTDIFDKMATGKRNLDEDKSIIEDIEYISEQVKKFPNNMYGAMCFRQLIDTRGMNLNTLLVSDGDQIHNIIQAIKLNKELHDRQTGELDKEYNETYKIIRDINQQYKDDLDKNFKEAKKDLQAQKDANLISKETYALELSALTESTRKMREDNNKDILLRIKENEQEYAEKVAKLEEEHLQKTENLDEITAKLQEEIKKTRAELPEKDSKIRQMTAQIEKLKLEKIGLTREKDEAIARKNSAVLLKDQAKAEIEEIKAEEERRIAEAAEAELERQRVEAQRIRDEEEAEAERRRKSQVRRLSDARRLKLKQEADERQRQLDQEAADERQRQLDQEAAERQRIEEEEAMLAQTKQNLAQFNIPEKIAEMKYYVCIISQFLQYNEDKVNKVFKNNIEKRKKRNLNFYKDTKAITEFYNTIDAETQVGVVKNVYQVIKNDYELFKGPVRVYLKLRKLLRMDNGDAQLFPTHNDANEFNIQALTENNCAKLIRDKAVQDDFDINELESLKMIEPTETHDFSRIYYSKKGGEPVEADYVFNDSVKDTIDNIIPINGSTVVMAYGPSGSGKTYNLIGENLETGVPIYGVIYKVLEYITTEYNTRVVNEGEKITSIELDSWQYYMLCGLNLPDSEKCKKFTSLSPYSDDVIKAISNVKINIPAFIDILHTFFNGEPDIYSGERMAENRPYTYKYERDEKVGLTSKDVFGVRKFKETTFDNTEKTKLGVYLERVLPDKFVERNLMGRFDIDNAIINEIGRENINKWDKIKKSVVGAGHITMTFKLDDNIFYQYSSPNPLTNKNEKGFQINVINNATTNPKRVLNDFSQSQNFKYLVDLDIIYVQVEAQLALIFAKRFSEYGQLTIPTFDDMFKLGRQNETRNHVLQIPVGGDYDTIQNTFTKFYIALSKARPTRATRNNKDSSRSHLVINIKIKRGNKASNFRFVDLAGNEKADENYFKMREEGNGITASLLAIKELLNVKQQGRIDKDVKQTIPEDEFNRFFTSCKQPKQQTSCKSLYKRCLNKFELKAPTGHKLLNLTNDMITVSMYLNLPTYLKAETQNPLNQCVAIGDSLYFIKKLQKMTKIEPEIKKLREGGGACTALYNEWIALQKRAAFGRYYYFGKKRSYRPVMVRKLGKDRFYTFQKIKSKSRWNPSKKVTQRRKMLKKCGKKCFYIPNKKNPKFPICNADCSINPWGVQAAYRRAKQWNYPAVAKKAKRDMTKLKTKSKSKTSKTKSKSKSKSKTKPKRKAPTASAATTRIGTKKKGNDGKMWKVKKLSNGVKRWVRYTKK